MAAPLHNQNAAKSPADKLRNQRPLRFTDSEVEEIRDYLERNPEKNWSQWGRETLLNAIREQE